MNDDELTSRLIELAADIERDQPLICMVLLNLAGSLIVGDTRAIQRLASEAAANSAAALDRIQAARN